MKAMNEKGVMKRVAGVHGDFERHWVGDGFPVRSVFDYEGLGKGELSPFLLMDYAGPERFEATEERRGVGEHPHRGFETVTVCYQGEVEHRDSHGGGGVIGPGDVQWMTAASGVLHEERHSERFAREGGVFEMAQLWVNLPAWAKGMGPRYQNLEKGRIPAVKLPSGDGSVRVIAGEFAGARGPAETVTPVMLLDGKLEAEAEVGIEVGEGWTAAVFVRRGGMRIGDERVEEGGLVVLERAGSVVELQTERGAEFLLMAGEPIEEAVVGYGPFVMNSEEEIRKAIEDVKTGKFGRKSKK